VLTQIDSIERLQVVFTLPEIAVGLAKPDIAFEFSVAPYPGETFPGEIFFVAPTLDPGTRRMLVKGWVTNAGHRLRPGLFANIEAEVGRKEDALTLPESALALDREGTFVWRVGSEDQAERVGVQTGLRVDGRVEIVRGLRAGDRVVAAGTNKVRRGSVVRAAAPPESHRAGPGEPGEGHESAELREAGGEGS
jgi:membrane fusion protein (multidrug efflux system)